MVPGSLGRVCWLQRHLHQRASVRRVKQEKKHGRWPRRRRGFIKRPWGRGYTTNSQARKRQQTSKQNITYSSKQNITYSLKIIYPDISYKTKRCILNVFIFTSKKRRDKYAANKVENEVTSANNETPGLIVISLFFF